MWHLVFLNSKHNFLYVTWSNAVTWLSLNSLSTINIVDESVGGDWSSLFFCLTDLLTVVQLLYRLVGYRSVMLLLALSFFMKVTADLFFTTAVILV